jgi:FKBP-type peptidyl-prolyl cis-trans isomerase
VRIRPLAALSVAAASVLLLTSCSGDAPDATQSPSAQVADLCDAVAPSGEASESVTVEGEPGAASQAVFTAPLEISELQSTVVTEGEGDAVEAGELVNIAFTAFSAETGEELGSLNYEPGQFLPQQISADNPIGQVLGCATPGTRVVATFPATETNGGEVYVFDFLETVPDAAWGTERPAPDGLPEVELADDGEPTITVPDADAPTEVELATLKQGDGETVEPGDTVLVQYTGVKWSDNEVFDSSWETGTPASFQTTGVVDGFRQALEGQTVGSQVLAVIPPEFGYGAVDGNELQEETLVFVVDILGVQHVAATTAP